jgi:hypothetical protein
MTGVAVSSKPKVIRLDIGLIQDLADEALGITAPLAEIREQLLDLTGPRVTPGMSADYRDRLRELAGQLAGVNLAVTIPLEAIATTISEAVDGDGV